WDRLTDVSHKDEPGTVLPQARCEAQRRQWVADKFGHDGREHHSSSVGAACGAAVGAENTGDRANAAVSIAVNPTASGTERDTDLYEVADRWATLPDAMRLAVMAIIRSVGW